MDMQRPVKAGWESSPGQRYPSWRTIWAIAIVLGLVSACTDGSPPEAGSTAQTSSANALTERVSNSDAESTPSTSGDAPTSPENSAAVLPDTLIVPGQRVGPITPTTGHSELAALVGEAALQDTQVAIGEGYTTAGTVVDLGPEYKFTVIWESNSRDRPTQVQDLGRAWQTPEGIGIGTSLADLQSILGPFGLYGFAWDYEGTVVLEDTALAAYAGHLILRLQPSPGVIEQNSEAYQAVMGDRVFSSENPDIQALDLVVDQMIVYFNPPEQ